MVGDLYLKRTILNHKDTKVTKIFNLNMIMATRRVEAFLGVLCAKSVAGG